MPAPGRRPDFARLRRRLTGSRAHRHPALLQVFDVLHLDGQSTRSLPYVERRALLEELALDGPAWRTPASLARADPVEFVARVAELGLEGVVAKRLESRYVPGRRSVARIKQKLRREERLAVTGVHRTQGRLDAVFVSRHQPDGSLAGAGSIELGLTAPLVASLEQRLAELPPRRHGALAWYPAEVTVIASVHGLSDGPVRDAILRQVVPQNRGSVLVDALS